MSKSGRHEFINQEVFLMNAVGIDVSKGKSTVAIFRPLGEIAQISINVSPKAVFNSLNPRFSFYLAFGG